VSKQKFVMPPEVVAQMEEVIADALSTYLTEFVPGLFPNFQEPQTQDCILQGIATAIRRYELITGCSITRTLALNLLDTKEYS
jgi:hypothetical protein